MRLCLEADEARVMTVRTSAGALEALDRSWFDVVFLGMVASVGIGPYRVARDSASTILNWRHCYYCLCFVRKRGRGNETGRGRLPSEAVHSRTGAPRGPAGGGSSVLRRQMSELQDRLDESEGEATFETQSSIYAAFLQTVARAAASDSVILCGGNRDRENRTCAEDPRAQQARGAPVRCRALPRCSPAT
jgi:two-component system, NtrC family, response regulator AlgB